MLGSSAQRVVSEFTNFWRIGRDTRNRRALRSRRSVIWHKSAPKSAPNAYICTALARESSAVALPRLTMVGQQRLRLLQRGLDVAILAERAGDVIADFKAASPSSAGICRRAIGRVRPAAVVEPCARPSHAPIDALYRQGSFLMVTRAIVGRQSLRRRGSCLS